MAFKTLVLFVLVVYKSTYLTICSQVMFSIDSFPVFFCLKSKSEGGQNSLGTSTSRQINWLSDQEIDYQLLPSFHLPFKPMGNSIPIAHE